MRSSHVPCDPGSSGVGTAGYRRGVVSVACDIGRPSVPEATRCAPSFVCRSLPATCRLHGTVHRLIAPGDRPNGSLEWPTVLPFKRSPLRRSGPTDRKRCDTHSSCRGGSASRVSSRRSARHDLTPPDLQARAFVFTVPTWRSLRCHMDHTAAIVDDPFRSAAAIAVSTCQLRRSGPLTGTTVRTVCGVAMSMRRPAIARLSAAR
jgi:hypothetical protein